jgi:hypothetical protein
MDRSEASKAGDDRWDELLVETGPPLERATSPHTPVTNDRIGPTGLKYISTSWIWVIRIEEE